MRQILEFIGYGLPVIGATSLFVKFYTMFVIPPAAAEIMMGAIIISLIYSVYWLRKVDTAWIEKSGMMSFLSFISAIVLGFPLSVYIFSVVGTGVISGIAAIYLRYKMAFEKKEERFYYPERFDIRDYRRIFLPVKNVEERLASFKNSEINIRSISSQLGLPLKKILKLLAKMEKEGKISIILRDGKIFLGGDRYEYEE